MIFQKANESSLECILNAIWKVLLPSDIYKFIIVRRPNLTNYCFIVVMEMFGLGSSMFSSMYIVSVLYVLYNA